LSINFVLLTFQVEILDVKPRINPSTGRTFGANFQGRSYTQSYIGTRYGDYNFTATNATTIMYEVISDAYGEWAQPVYQFTTPQFLSPGEELCFFLHVFGLELRFWHGPKTDC
jgi:hypothetical protein